LYHLKQARKSCSHGRATQNTAHHKHLTRSLKIRFTRDHARTPASFGLRAMHVLRQQRRKDFRKMRKNSQWRICIFRRRGLAREVSPRQPSHLHFGGWMQAALREQVSVR
jgi:hypothetical protein